MTTLANSTRLNDSSVPRGPAYPLITVKHWLDQLQFSVKETVRHLENLSTTDALATELQQHSLDVLRDLQPLLDISLYPEQVTQLADEYTRLNAALAVSRRPRVKRGIRCHV